ncbi:metallophosphoesterase [Longimicrobium sp.]|uniref:metallophosphoesterase n=1 Tax=Longimicrobium sp. TaxID=2029185 RepID=UPI002E32DF19|nr:metallophosphoesterase [Longimicrobium sp.]HEX6036521.1 metallophosphoesterase [Longimicrobium sp.]
MKRILGVLAALAVFAGTAAAQQAPLYYWVQAGAGGQWLLRTVYDGATACPAPATVRWRPGGDFPVLVCQQTLGSAPVQLPGMARPVSAPSRVQRVVVIGDTGCRAQEQNCADITSWPFARVAAGAFGADGDLSVHVGDYIYRERCSAQVPQPCGDNWPTWVADWFRPVGELLSASPWVFARGNHEDCTRGGRGWFIFFDPRDLPATGCSPTTAPYAVPVQGVGTLLILDSSCAPWYSTGCWSTGGSNPVNDSTQAIPAYATELAALTQLAQGADPAWQVTHTPVWARDQGNEADSAGSYILQGALRRVSPGGGLPPQVKLSLFGHIHLWEGLDFAAPRTPLLVLGNGGTSEVSGITPAAPGTRIDGVPVEGFWMTAAFGYTVLQASGAGWTATLVPVPGTGSGMTCTVGDAQMACR